jgi:amphiphysin
LTKLRDKKEKSLNDEKNLFKVRSSAYSHVQVKFSASQLEQDFEIATNEYDAINNAMKTDLPRFMALATQFIDPLFQSYFYMQYVNLSFQNRPLSYIPHANFGRFQIKYLLSYS